MSRRTPMFMLLLATALVAAAPAFAGKVGSSSASSSSIAIASINGVASATTLTAQTPKLGDTLKFGTTVQPLAGWEYPMVAVSCYQDVNLDGTIDTNLLGPDIVYAWLDTPTAGFLLGAYSSIWTQRGGGPATCHAELDAYGWKGGKESTRVLASTGNWVANG